RRCRSGRVRHVALRFHPASAVAVASIGLLAVGAGSASGSAVVTGIRSAPSVTAGARLNVRLTVAGKGKTQLALLLSTDRRRSRDDIAIGKTSRPGAHKTWTARARVPRHMTPRLSYLLACRAGSRSCRSASQRVAVLP